MNKFKVPIKNALFMYSYIWDKVETTNDYIDLEANDDFNSANIYVELFLINIKKILKRGLYKEYININEPLNVIKGRIDFTSTINSQQFKNGKIYCDYDEFEENNIYNQILKYIAIRLYKTSGVNSLYKKKLNKVILYFNKVNFIDLNKRVFKKLNYNKSNNYYFLMMKICELIFNSQMLSETTGKYSFYDLFNTDENMNIVFELFINKFYAYELSNDYKVKYQAILNWNITGDNTKLLPIMKLDTLITTNSETIIIDTKYYKNYIDKNYFDTKKLKSTHFYQMMAYLNNINCETKYLSGILLYPKPFDEDNINEVYNVKVVNENITKDATLQFVTVDLSNDWKEIKTFLLELIYSNKKSS